MCECEDRIAAAPGKPRPGERRPAGREGARPPTPAPVRNPRPGPRPRVAPGVWLFHPSRRALRSAASRTCCPLSVNTIKLGKCPRSQRFPTSGAGLGKAIAVLVPNPSGLGSVAVRAPRRVSAGPVPGGGWGDPSRGRGAASPPRSVLVRVPQDLRGP